MVAVKLRLGSREAGPRVPLGGGGNAFGRLTPPLPPGSSPVALI